MTKPLAGRTGARIVGTISGTAHRPRPINSAVHSATNGTGGASTTDTHHTTTDHELRTTMSQPNFPPARLFDAFAKPASTEQPTKKGLLGKLRLGESSEEDNYTTVMLVGFNSAKEPPGNGEDALDVIHRAFDPCDESPGFDMDDFYDYGSVAPQLQNSDDSESTVLVWPKMFYNMVTIPERRLRLLVVTGPAPSLCLQRFMTRFFKYVKKLHVDHAIFVETFEDQVAHTRPYPYTLTTHDEKLAAIPGILHEDYTGSTSVTMAMSALAAEHGLRSSVMLRMSIPGYLSFDQQNPRAVVSLIEALEVILGIKVESEEYDRLRTHADEWEAELAEEMAKDYEKVELVREIEQKMDSTLRTVSGEVIAEDIEGYLDSLSSASEGVNPADDGADSAEDSSER